jgi:hypothetical protein
MGSEYASLLHPDLIIPYETMQARLEGLILGLGLSLLSVMVAIIGSLYRYAAHLLF